ncbi:MAG: biopolymer transporter ExbD [Sulfuricurvum sp. PC08-66]|nr:MAG: biopolymer transporter ExbD [Sulfuricurvum sp. PC08-66]
MQWDEKPELNITPLVDIMLVLLAIMMVVSPAIIYEEKVTLPQGSQQSTVVKHHPIEIVVDRNKIIHIKDQKYTFDTFADDFLLYAQSFPRDTTVMILADRVLLYDNVIWVLKSVKNAGFTHVSLATDG